MMSLKPSFRSPRMFETGTLTSSKITNAVPQHFEYVVLICSHECESGGRDAFCLCTKHSRLSTMAIGADNYLSCLHTFAPFDEQH